MHRGQFTTLTITKWNKGQSTELSPCVDLSLNLSVQPLACCLQILWIRNSLKGSLSFLEDYICLHHCHYFSSGFGCRPDIISTLKNLLKRYFESLILKVQSCHYLIFPWADPSVAKKSFFLINGGTKIRRDLLGLKEFLLVVELKRTRLQKTRYLKGRSKMKRYGCKSWAAIYGICWYKLVVVLTANTTHKPLKQVAQVNLHHTSYQKVSVNIVCIWGLGRKA